MLFNQHTYDNMIIQGIPTLERLNGNNQMARFAPMKRIELDGRISGPIGEFTLTQVFIFHHDDLPGPIEAVYRFPIPGDAAVTGLTVSFGEVTIETILLPRRQAEDDYHNARNSHRQAILLTRESSDIFTLMVNGIAPENEVRIDTRFIQAGVPEKTGFSFRIPLTTAPRYLRGDEQSSRHAQGNPIAVLFDPLHRFAARLTLSGEGSLSSPTHHLKRSEQIYTLSGGDVIPNQDFVVLFRPIPDEEKITVQVFTSGEKEPCILALISPPFLQQPRIPLDVIILVDHSGSMDGRKRKAADSAVIQFLSNLTPKDYFNLCCFDDRQYWYTDRPVPATVNHIIPAMDLLLQNHSGGTELGVVIEQALLQTRSPGSASRHLIIITDAEVSDGGRIFQIIENEASRPDFRRCSVLCIDSSPNTLLARRIAEKSGGIIRFLTSSPDQYDISEALSDILTSWEYIIADRIFFTLNRDSVLTRERCHTDSSGQTKIHVTPVGIDHSSWIFLKPGGGEDPLVWFLDLPDESICVPVFYESASVKRLFGAWMIENLEYLMHSEATDDEIFETLQHLGLEKKIHNSKDQSCIYAENRMSGLRTHLSSVIEQVSLRYGIISCETAFFAARSEAGEKTLVEVVIPSAFPDGWEISSYCDNQHNIRPGTSDPGLDLMSLRSMRRCDFASGPDIRYHGELNDLSFGQVGNDTPPPSSGDQMVGVLTQIKKQRHSTPGKEQYTVAIFYGVPSVNYGSAILFESGIAPIETEPPDIYQITGVKFLTSPEKKSFEEISGFLELLFDDFERTQIIIPLIDILNSGRMFPLDIDRDTSDPLIVKLRDPDRNLTENNIIVSLVFELINNQKESNEIKENQVTELP